MDTVCTVQQQRDEVGIRIRDPEDLLRTLTRFTKEEYKVPLRDTIPLVLRDWFPADIDDWRAAP
jgi:hypothetical protein